MAEENPADRLELSEVYRRPVLERVLDFLDPPPGSWGLEVGCGIGSLTLPLARRLGPSGRVIGLDIEGRLLARAEERAGRLELKDRISWLQGDMTALPFATAAFDWLISLDCAGYAPSNEPASLVGELARVVKPGGFVGLAAWSGQTLLPGQPQLEARLKATSAGLAPWGPDRPPAKHFLNALSWFKKAGLSRGRSASLSGRIKAPLSGLEKAALTDLLRMRWSGAERELNRDEAALFRRLANPDSADFVLNRSDYRARFSYTVFKGLKS